jgi:hypothetical protein
MNRLWGAFGASVAAAVLAGCGTVSGVADSKSEGVARVYAVGQERAKEITRKIFADKEVESVEERPGNLLVGTVGMGWMSMGTVVGCWLDPVDADHTRATVLCKRKMATNVVTYLSEEEFHQQFSALAGAAIVGP